MSNVTKKYKKALLKVNDIFPNVDVVDFLTDKGIDFTDKGDWLRMSCLMPDHDDKHPSFFIHKENGGYNCMSCGAKGNWGQLCDIFNWDNKGDGVGEIVDTVPDSIWNIIKREVTLLNEDEDRNKHFKPPNGYEIITNQEKHTKFKDYLFSRKLQSLVGMFPLYCTLKEDDDYGKSYMNRILIPVHNEIGMFSWMEGRKITDGGKKRYYRPSGVDKTRYLFNYHRVAKSGIKFVIVVEGIIDAMILWRWGYPAVCCFGWNLSEEQIELLSAFDSIMLCLDNDKAGLKGYEMSKEKIVGIGSSVFRIKLPFEKDINDISYKHWVKIFDKCSKVV